MELIELCLERRPRGIKATRAWCEGFGKTVVEVPESLPTSSTGFSFLPFDAVRLLEQTG
jgi:hypothetical protein